MNIARLDYNHDTGALEIYVSGCTRGCKGCHNPELHDFNAGRPWADWVGLLAAEYYTTRVMVMGGEPMEQDHKELCALLDFLADHYTEIWLFTGHTIIPDTVWDRVHVFKTGAYLEHCKSDIPMLSCFYDTCITLASYNQQLIPGGKRLGS